MKLEVGMYVRFYNGDFGKVANYEYREEYVNGHIIHLENDDIGLCCEEKDFKASHNITDLIEVGDIIKFKELRTHLTNESGTKFYGNYVVSIFNEEELKVAKEEIEGKHMKLLSIVTKEQFEAMQYKVV